ERAAVADLAAQGGADGGAMGWRCHACRDAVAPRAERAPGDNGVSLARDPEVEATQDAPDACHVARVAIHQQAPSDDEDWYGVPHYEDEDKGKRVEPKGEAEEEHGEPITDGEPPRHRGPPSSTFRMSA